MDCNVKKAVIPVGRIEQRILLIRNEKVDGVLTGFIDSMLPYYQQICEKAGLHCYATKEQIEIATNKSKFKQLCREHNIPVVEEYKIDKSFRPEDLKDIVEKILSILLSCLE